MQDQTLRVWRGGPVATGVGKDFGRIADGVVVARGDRIVYVGAAAGAPVDLLHTADETHELAGRLVTPGLIDCHTHLVFGGDRATEWAMRLEGAPYAEIARAGGGILSTVTATRGASEAELTAAALPRLDSLLADGVTTLEIKSGYGLTRDDELKMLRVARQLGAVRAVRVRTTLLAAHAVPPEYRDDRNAYLAYITDEILPAAAQAGLADAVDAFCETIAFRPEEVAHLFAAATRLGLRVKLHADQLSDSGGAALAARFGALSADHLEFSNPEGLAAMAEAGVVGVLLPGAYYVLREKTAPPVAAMRQVGLAMAVASDCNPGTSPLASLRLALHLACTLFGLTPQEAFAGATTMAAKALGLDHDLGCLAPGYLCDLAIWEADHPLQIMSNLGRAPACRRVVGGISV